MTNTICVAHAKRKLASDQHLPSMAVNKKRSPNVAMIAQVRGFDTIYNDLEYNPISLETEAGFGVAEPGIDIAPSARETSQPPATRRGSSIARPRASVSVREPWPILTAQFTA